MAPTTRKTRGVRTSHRQDRNHQRQDLDTTKRRRTSSTVPERAQNQSVHPPAAIHQRPRHPTPQHQEHRTETPMGRIRHQDHLREDGQRETSNTHLLLALRRSNRRKRILPSDTERNAEEAPLILSRKDLDQHVSDERDNTAQHETYN